MPIMWVAYPIKEHLRTSYLILSHGSTNKRQFYGPFYYAPSKLPMYVATRENLNA